MKITNTWTNTEYVTPTIFSSYNHFTTEIDLVRMRPKVTMAQPDIFKFNDIFKFDEV